ncbi:MAG: hypothetical protein J5966_01400, partial [Lachnospiraceae bacterium]|nr:hypothetical protein [Lachnospiraceae bacterium]
NRLFCLNKEGTRLRVLSLDTYETEEREVPFNGLYTGVVRDISDLDVMWFLPYEGTVLGKWTLSEDKWETVDVRIEGLKSIKRPEGMVCNTFYFSNAVFFKGKMLLAPNWGNKFVEVDTVTNESKEWQPPFAYSTEDKNDYWFNGSIGYFYQDLWTLEYFFYYAPEHKHYALDMEKGTYEELSVTFDKEEITGMALGFHRDSQWMPYCCYEDVFNSLEGIISGHINGAAFDRERQLLAYRTVNASPDGDCGEKVYKLLSQTVE